ncbi:chemotaxis response regulator protein-glutamate methylesterase [Bacillus sp. DNRA2]|uniref:protein-glutamate methylesterase/protein-glutamine glutaminase n=1 Tax=Bacillus sp. DNRA2 TaxID=2723053 RepID=UPI00145D3D89|nr:chemotaxis response regulator protein-glutamate methylesterase [Bacillus sp. DNRA2]NMD69108.1 chemotaxis response regulator protein-glutamate methylesterase [Bacillus sp. DNRA2]
MKKYGILVVDDSAFMRRGISKILENDPHFFVVGIARNGQEAVEKVQRLAPDLVTMDVEMPVMNGLQALEEIMRISPVPVVMLSSYTGEGAAETLKALELGAVDFFLKENLLNVNADVTQIQEFLLRLQSIAEVKMAPAAKKVQFGGSLLGKKNHPKPDLIFIGCSTGGPSALQHILPRFEADFSIPIVVCQHMPPGFTAPLAERFDTLCQLKVTETANGHELKPGTIYIAPSGFQTRFLKTKDGKMVFKVDNHGDEQTLYKPCIDITLSSAAPLFEDRLLSVILTGMGTDGMQGCGLVKRFKGNVFVEAEDSCVIYGMPKAVLEAGYADGQFSISQMYREIINYL